MNLTFKHDTQLNNQEDYIPAGTVVSIPTNLHESYLSTQLSHGHIPVIINHAYTYNGEYITLDPTIEWFSPDAFEEDI